ncbi:CHAT domain-containing protein [Leptolyngbya ohadii]|uniref:CHAT domain-containing protein n=1 Tax=Leptolyngbya ohadii TaxID=1962290 RepID=UPI000B5995EA|nr:CHAT domain-containing protein [Leptolyngbya ohadii]
MKRRKGRFWRFICIAGITAFLCGLTHGIPDRAIGATLPASSLTSTSIAPAATPQELPFSIAQISDSQTLLQQAQRLYEAGQYQQAIPLLQQAVLLHGTEENWLQQALALSNLSLTYQQLGQWTEATQAIETSLERLASLNRSPAQLSVLAQTLDIQGRLYLAQGQPDRALPVWQQAADVHQQSGNSLGAVQSQINQAEALQQLGLYRRAIAQLTEVAPALTEQPNSLSSIIALRSLGNALLVAGDLVQARQRLEQSLAIAQSFSDPAAPNELATSLLSLGNLTRAEALAQFSQQGRSIRDAIATPRNTAQPAYQTLLAALDLYQQAAEQAQTLQTRIQAQLNRLQLLIETQQWQAAQQLYPVIQAQLPALPPGRSTLEQQIQLAEIVMQRSEDWNLTPQIAQLLENVYQQASASSDRRTQSYALGMLGKLYELPQPEQAQTFTEKALSLSQAIGATDISYRWQWQLGRLLKAQGKRDAAIAAYDEAIRSIQALRNDLVSINRDVQFSFREAVEPAYREFVSLLLQPNAGAQQLIRAREIIEGLQIAELDNFFREACLDTQFQLDRVVEQENLSAAILYPIILDDRLEVIVKLPQQPLLHYTVSVSQETVETTVDRLLIELKRPFTTRNFQQLSQQMYEWLVQPIAPQLGNDSEGTTADRRIDTLVFVLDGTLRNIPMAALYDGNHYLVERYAVAVAPGLQLPDPKPLQSRKVQALVAGLSEARSNFPALTYVQQEVETIRSELVSTVLFNQSFTRSNLQQQIRSDAYSIVHIATHGQFSSNAEETFILAWDDPINVNELRNVLQARDLNAEPIELLVLSACQTAVGDRRAALGLAGIAVRAGSRSTIASLWNLDDESGAEFMSRFYQELLQHPISKAEALRRAQQALLQSPQYAAPRFWAPFILLGNWL